MTELGGEPDFAVHRFSTDDLPEKDRLAQWRDVCGRAMMKVEMEPLTAGPFRCVAELRSLPHLAIASIATTPNRLTRSRDLLADGNDDFILVMSVAGDAAISRRNQELTLAPSGAGLIPADQPSSTVVRSLSRFISVAIPAAILSPLVADIDAALHSAIPPNTEAVRLLVSYLECLRADVALAEPALRRLAVIYIHDLVALAVGARRDAAEIAKGRGVRAARLQAIKADILANTASGGLSIDAIAARQNITPRYVRMLFESEGTSFSEFVLAQRLTRAHRMLNDKRFSDRPISAIAFDCGFNDLSYFNRTFRRRFGDTPSAVRAEAVRSWDA